MGSRVVRSEPDNERDGQDQAKERFNKVFEADVGEGGKSKPDSKGAARQRCDYSGREQSIPKRTRRAPDERPCGHAGHQGT